MSGVVKKIDVIDSIGDLKFTNKVKKIEKTYFGDLVFFDLPDWADCVIICYNKYGLVPVQLCLPHQVYLKKLINIQEEYKPNSITIIPVKSDSYINILKES